MAFCILEFASWSLEIVSWSLYLPPRCTSPPSHLFKPLVSMGGSIRLAKTLAPSFLLRIFFGPHTPARPFTPLLSSFHAPTLPPPPILPFSLPVSFLLLTTVDGLAGLDGLPAPPSLFFFFPLPVSASIHAPPSLRARSASFSLSTLAFCSAALSRSALSFASRLTLSSRAFFSASSLAFAATERAVSAAETCRYSRRRFSSLSARLSALMHDQQGKCEGRRTRSSEMSEQTVLERKPGRHISMYGRSEGCVQVWIFFQYLHMVG